MRRAPGLPVALFLVDERMPEMTGTQFLKEAIKVYPDARKVLLTAYADTETAIMAINQIGLDHYLLKPWEPPAERLYPDALIDGKEATVDEAVEAAAEFLHKADMPLVYGLSNTTCEAQREAVWLAELVGGVIDSHTSL